MLVRPIAGSATGMLARRARRGDDRQSARHRRGHDRRSACSRARTSPTTCPADALGALLDSGEARREFKRLAVTHADGAGADPRRARRPRRSSTPSGRGWPRRWRTGRAREIGADDAVLGGPPPRRRRGGRGAGRGHAAARLPVRPLQARADGLAPRSSGCSSAPTTTSSEPVRAATIVTARPEPRARPRQHARQRPRRRRRWPTTPRSWPGATALGVAVLDEEAIRERGHGRVRGGRPGLGPGRPADPARLRRPGRPARAR